MRKLVAITAIALTGILTPGAVQAEESGLSGDPGKEAEFVAAINSLRADHGLPSLAVHEQLTAKARDWSHTMAEAGEIWHSNLPDGITVNWKRLGENVGMGGSVEALHQAFIDSPSHYENLVDPGFRHVGIGVTVNAEGTIFVSEVFMELASQPAPAAPIPAAGTPSSPSASAPDSPPATAGQPEPAPVERPRAAASPEAGEGDPRPEASARITSVLDRLRAFD
ncbi:MAG TPA: CAP domain-containing protein [Acidimicrobiia bacterium]|nr:CAP domain-containing protein [Acidimicrobiia bacterium]